MQLNQYQQEIKRTCPDLGSEATNLAHMVLGIYSEYAEYLDAVTNNDITNIGEEISDSFWYFGNYCNFRGYDLQEIWENRESNQFIMYNNYRDYYNYSISLLQDLTKKNLAYGKEIYRLQEEQLLKNSLYYLHFLFIDYNIDLGKILGNNVDKLRKRFPEKFDTYFAINRNLEAERIELEK